MASFLSYRFSCGYLIYIFCTNPIIALLSALLYCLNGLTFFLQLCLDYLGFVCCWSCLPCLCYVHQEKQRNRIKEKLEKFNKEKLLDFCEVLDINVKVTTKKVSWLS